MAEVPAAANADRYLLLSASTFTTPVGLYLPVTSLRSSRGLLALRIWLYIQHPVKSWHIVCTATVQRWWWKVMPMTL